MVDTKIDLKELKDNTTSIFTFIPVIGKKAITLEITKAYADKIGAVYNDFVNPEVNIIVTDKELKILKGTSISDGCISTYVEIDKKEIF